MHEILRNLPRESLVLDLGCATGSFAPENTAATAIRVDRGRPAQIAAGFVQADAAQLPFRDGTFAAVISNHSLEHFDDLAGSLREMGRVVRRDGSLFVAVPDAATLTDKIYRWLGRGGGHVNAFTDDAKLAAEIENATGLKHVATRTLYSSLSFLNRRTAPQPLPRRIYLLGGGYPWTLFLYVWLTRRLATRLGVYGWALYFGNVPEPVSTRTLLNVCIQCGAGHPSALLASNLRMIFPGIRVWRCSGCGTVNPFTEDRCHVL